MIEHDIYNTYYTSQNTRERAHAHIHTYALMKITYNTALRLSHTLLMYTLLLLYYIPESVASISLEFFFTL